MPYYNRMQKGTIILTITQIGYIIGIEGLQGQGPIPGPMILTSECEPCNFPVVGGLGCRAWGYIEIIGNKMGIIV